MPNIKSAEKRMRQTVGRKAANRHKRTRMRTEIKKFKTLVVEEKIEEAQVSLKKVYAVIDRTAQKGVIHSNTAARQKSRLTKYLTRAASS